MMAYLSNYFLKSSYLAFGSFLLGFTLIWNLNTNKKDSKKPQKVYGKDHPLVNIRDVAFKDSVVIVLTGSFPSIHIFGDDYYRSFGNKGNGPNELDGPSSVEVFDDKIFVLDERPGNCKIVSYNLQGKYLLSVPLREEGFCKRLKVSNNYKIVEIGKIFDTNKEIMISNENKSFKTIYSFKEPKPIKVSPPEGPMRSYSLQNPFIGQPTWSANKKGEIVFWDGKNSYLSILDIPSGEKKGRIEINDKNNIEVQSDAIDNWINEEYPSGRTLFGKKDFFGGVRSELKKLSFPDYYPLLKDIKIDPLGGIWLLKAFYRDSGEVWSYIFKNRNEQIIHFPENREILSFEKRFVVAKTKKGNGIELVELYNRSQFLNN